MKRKSIFDLYNEQNPIEEKPPFEIPKIEHVETPVIERMKDEEVEEVKEVKEVKEQEVIETPLEDKGVSSLAN